MLSQSLVGHERLLQLVVVLLAGFQRAPQGETEHVWEEQPLEKCVCAYVQVLCEVTDQRVSELKLDKQQRTHCVCAALYARSVDPPHLLGASQQYSNYFKAP